jgi:hypothetical protein
MKAVVGPLTLDERVASPEQLIEVLRRRKHQAGKQRNIWQEGDITFTDPAPIGVYRSNLNWRIVKSSAIYLAAVKSTHLKSGYFIL